MLTSCSAVVSPTWRMVSYTAGETRHFHCGPCEFLLHNIENFGQTDLVVTTVDQLDSDNTPLGI
jgi:beta-alanine degradation protein BauB